MHPTKTEPHLITIEMWRVLHKLQRAPQMTPDEYAGALKALRDLQSELVRHAPRSAA